jgi:hypothetical protein
MTTDRIETMDELRKRLAEIGKELDDLEEGDAKRADLIDEEHRLESRMQKLSDDSVSDNEGVAERLVEEEGASADEIPKLPDETEEPGDEDPADS